MFSHIFQVINNYVVVLLLEDMNLQLAYWANLFVFIWNLWSLVT